MCDISAGMMRRRQSVYSQHQEKRFLARSPIEVYSGIINTRLANDMIARIEKLTQQFSKVFFAEQPLSVHLLKTIQMLCRLVSSIDSRSSATQEDVSAAVDTVEYFASTSRWGLSRDQPGFVIRPTSQDPRLSLRAIGSIQLAPAALVRINSAIEKLSNFLDEHRLGSSKECSDLCESVFSVWVLLSGLSAHMYGRKMAVETDFEIAYDVTRILMFYTPPEEFKTLTAIRLLGTSPNIPRLAKVELTLGFEKLLESSDAARLERKYGEQLIAQHKNCSVLFRSLLTNSLRFLSQFVAAKSGSTKIEAQGYLGIVTDALTILSNLGVDSALLRDELSVSQLYQQLVPSRELNERLTLLTRQLENLIISSSQDKDILLSHQSLVPRMISLILLLAGGTGTSVREELADYDLKRAVRLLSKVIATT